MKFHQPKTGKAYCACSSIFCQLKSKLLPRGPHCRHVQQLGVAEVDLGRLTTLASLLPAVEGVEGSHVIGVAVAGKVAL